VDHARLLYALDVQTQPAPVPALVLWMGLPAAVIGGVVHAPALWVVWRLAQRQAKARQGGARCTRLQNFTPGRHLVPPCLNRSSCSCNENEKSSIAPPSVNRPCGGIANSKRKPACSRRVTSLWVV
jgi:hypothetical protein